MSNFCELGLGLIFGELEEEPEVNVAGLDLITEVDEGTGVGFLRTIGSDPDTDRDLLGFRGLARREGLVGGVVGGIADGVVENVAGLVGGVVGEIVED